MTYFSGSRIRALRESSQLSLSDVHERTGISRAQISRIETGKADPRMSTITVLLTCYGATLSDLDVDRGPAISSAELKRRAREATRRLREAGYEPSDPVARLDRKAALGFDVDAEARSLATRK